MNLLPRMAGNNIRKNGSAYLPYIGISVFAMFTYFVFDLILKNDIMYTLPKGAYALILVQIGFGLLGIIMVPFLYYTNSFLIKRRKRELGLYSILGLEKKTRIYQASTSELFGKVQEVPQKETTPFYPRSPYGVAKQYGFWITKNYRESYGMFAVNGILFNHESERRGETFVTRKISLAAARIAQGEQDKLYLGNLDARRDWGYAKDYVECMWLILQHDVPEDFVIATGEMHTVREFATLAFKEAGIELRWEGEGVNEKGIDVVTGKTLVEVDPKYFRPSEVEQLLGDPTKAKTLLGWNPCKTSFEELVSIMVRHDMEKVKRMIATKH